MIISADTQRFFYREGHETVFFGADLYQLWRIHDREAYLALYRDKDPGVFARDKQV